MESDSRDRYESDNLIWQLDITFKKLSAICKKNGKLVDYINKKVDKTVSEWRNSKDKFKKLTWAELDDSDLDLDLDITLPSPLSILPTLHISDTSKGEQPLTAITPTAEVEPEGMEAEKSISQIDDNAANPDRFSENNDIIEGTMQDDALAMQHMQQTVIDLINTTIAQKAAENEIEHENHVKAVEQTNVNNVTLASTCFVAEKCSKCKHIKKKKSKKKKKKIKGKLMFVKQKLLRRKKKMEATEKSEIEKTEKKKLEQHLRMKRAEKRKLEQHKMLKQKNKKLTSKLKEIKLNDNMVKKHMVNAIKERQSKAEKKKQKIKNNKKKHIIAVNKKLAIFEKLNQVETKKMEENLNKRLKNAANKRHLNQLNRSQSRKDSLSISISTSKDDIIPPVEELEHENKDIDSGKYIDVACMRRLSGKFLHIPRVVRKSSASCTDLYANIESLYNHTNNILLSPGKHKKICNIEDILKLWFKNTHKINFGAVKYNKDVLLVINRLTCFDLNKLNIKSAKLMVKNLILLCKNKMGLELLSFKYSLKLWMYYKFCLHEYFVKHDQSYKWILPQLAIVLVKILQNAHMDVVNVHKEKEYNKFKRQTQSFLLLNLYKSAFLNVISVVFECISNENYEHYDTDQRIIDAILNVLIEIPLIVNDNGTGMIGMHAQMSEIYEFINNQMVKIQIIDFIYKLINKSIKFNKKSLIMISKCFQLLIFNKSIISKVLIKNKENIVDKFYKILTFLFDFICNNFNIDCDYILQATNNIFLFVTLISLNNKQIQDIFDRNLINKLCENIPFYFILQPKGQNILFPLLIAISLNHKKNLNFIKLSLNIQHLQVWFKRNIYKNDKNDPSQFSDKIPSKIWANCLRFYNV